MPDDNHPEPGSRWDPLTKTGAGTPMGELLRRYWFPVAAACELGERSVKAVQLLGERLVVYRDAAGRTLIW